MDFWGYPSDSRLFSFGKSQKPRYRFEKQTMKDD